MDDNTSGGSYGYRMSKAALNSAAKSLAFDLKPRGIAVAILHPGLVQTRMIGFNPNGIAPESAVQGLLNESMRFRWKRQGLLCMPMEVLLCDTLGRRGH